MREIQQSTSTINIPIFMVQSIDHITPATGRTVTVKLGKNGAAGVTASGAITEPDSTNLPGQYKLAGNTTDSNTLGPLTIYATAAGCDPYYTEYNIVAYNPFNSNLGLSHVSANADQINGVSTSSVTTVNANIGTTQPVNFTGTGSSALAKSDMVDIAGSAVSTSSAQLGVNVVNVGGSASAGSAGYVGLDWGHINAPTAVVDLSGTTIKNVDNAIATVTNLTNAPTNGDFTATMKTSLNAATPASVTGAVGSVTGNVGGNVNGNVVGSVGSVVSTVSANLAQILGTALTETTGGWLAAAFKKFFNLATPTSTMNEITLVDTTTNLTNTPTIGNVTLAASQPLYAPAKATDILSDATPFAGANIAAIKAEADGIAAIPTNPVLAPSIIIASGTAQASSATSLTLQAGTVGNFMGLMLHIKTGSNSPQAVPITGYSGLVATVASWPGGTPSSNATYEVVISGGGSSGSGGDPWSTILGTYPANSAGDDLYQTFLRTGTVPITANFISPVDATQSVLSIIKGNQYTSLTGTQLEFTVLQPDTTITDCTLKLGGPTVNNTLLTVTGTVIAGGTKAQFELTSAQTEMLYSINRGSFSVTGTPSTGLPLLVVAWGTLLVTSVQGV